MQNKTILALDLGTKAGFSWQQHNSIGHGNENLAPKGRIESEGMRYVKFEQLLNKIKNVLQHIDIVVFEEVKQRPLSVKAGHVYGGLMATLTKWCEEEKINYTSIPVGTWKKHLTGKGNAGKLDVQAAIKAQGFDFGTEDEADAIGILKGYLAENA